MRQLASLLGVSTGTIYHYFGSKDEIFEQMVERIASRDVEAAIATIPESASRSERLQFIAAWVGMNRHNLQRVLLLIFDFQRHRSDDEARDLVGAGATQYRQAIEAQVGRVPGLWPMILGCLTAGLLDENDNDPLVWSQRIMGLLEDPAVPGLTATGGS